MVVNKCKYCYKDFTSPRVRITCSSQCQSKLKYQKAKEENKPWFLELNSSERKREFLQKRKENLVALFGGSCQVCNYSKCNRALEFHHVEKNKEKNISEIMHLKIEKITAELDKCKLLCIHCHKKQHINGKNNENEYQIKLRSFLKLKAGNQCSNCSIEDSDLLEFHHINPADKKFTISNAIASRWSIEKVAPEVNKCSLVCGICHREHHAGFDIKMSKINISQSHIDEFINNNGQKRVCRMCTKEYKATKITSFCSDRCGKEYKERKDILKNEFINKCALCFNTYLTVTKSTTDKCLTCIRDSQKKNGLNITLVRETYIKNDFNLVITANELNISDNAVKKRLIKYFPNDWEKWQFMKKTKTSCGHCSKEIFKYIKNEKIHLLQRYCSEKCSSYHIKKVYSLEEITITLEKTNFNISQTAKKHALSRKALRKFLLKHNISRPN